MEEQDRQELEDLLFEAREEKLKAKLHSGNRKFLKLLLILAVLNFILFPFDYERISPDLSSALGLILFIQGFLLAVGSLLSAAFVSLFKFAPWGYANRLIRTFLLFYLSASGMLLLLLIMNLARYRFHLYS